MGSWQTKREGVMPLLKMPSCTLFPVICVVLVLILPFPTQASTGDRSTVFRNLLRSCLNMNCSGPQQLHSFTARLPLDLWLLRWNCEEECRYQVMWQTVQHYLKEGMAVPQFYGKWPFIRVLGIQEPASVIFSIANGLAQIFFIHQLRSRVPKTTPMYYVGHVQGAVAINAWIWSTVFHSRDWNWTEMMDYFCAYSIVLCSLGTALTRIFAVSWSRTKRLVVVVIGVVLSIVYLRHISYLAFIHFDYGYNMKVNIITAMLSLVAWFSWSAWHIRLQPYLWKAMVSIVSVNVCILLEVLDFPPVWWTFDAHSLWHASTIPIAFLWTSFFIDDCLYLHHYNEKLRKGV